MRAAMSVVAVVALAGAIIGESLDAYSLSGHYWGSTSVSYYVNASNGDMSQQSAIAAIQAAAANWLEQSSANIRLVYAGATSGSSLVNNRKNEVFFRNTTSGSRFGATYYWYGSDGHLIDFDTIFYDGGTRFFPGSSGCSSGMYLEDIATHELGHALGIAHSSLATATMYPSLSPWCAQTWRTLSSDDISAVQKAYPGKTATSSLPAVPRLYSPLNLATSIVSATSGFYLRWYSTAGATSYDVYFGASSSPGKVASVVPPAGLSTVFPGTVYQSVATYSSKTYYWRIVARNSAGATSSATWKFTTR
jgi:hypothetical protein